MKPKKRVLPAPTLQGGCDRKWRSVLSDGEVNPVKIPEIVGTSHAQSEYGLGARPRLARIDASQPVSTLSRGLKTK